MKRVIRLLIAVALCGVLFLKLGTEATAQGDEFWTAAYFNGSEPTATPAYTGQIPGFRLGLNWGYGSPVPGVIAYDNFSVHLSGRFHFNEGNLRFAIQADDGVRFSIDGQSLLNEWHPASGTPYFVDYTFSTGVHELVLDYYDRGAAASLLVDWAYVAPADPLTDVEAVLNYSFINVRNGPGATYPLIGRETRTATETRFGVTGYTYINSATNPLWWRIDHNGIRGWISNTYVRVFGNTSQVPYVGPSGTTDGGIGGVPQGGVIATLNNAWLNVRSGPSTAYPVVGRMILGQGQQAYRVLGRSVTNPSWWMIDYFGSNAWIHGAYVRMEGNASEIPYMRDDGTQVSAPPEQPQQPEPPEEPQQPEQPAGTPTATLNNLWLNVRSGPGTGYPIIGRWYQGVGAQSYPISGRSAVSPSWWQISFDGQTGWISGSYVTVSGDLSGVPYLGADGQPVTDGTGGAFPETGVTATLNNAWLNVRSGPGTHYSILGRLYLGQGEQAFPVTGRYVNNPYWYRITYQGQQAWVSGLYMRFSRDVSQVPYLTALGEVAPEPAPLPPVVSYTPGVGGFAGYRARALYDLNLRSLPTYNVDRVTMVPLNAVVDVLGSNSTGSWWLVLYNGVHGWVPANTVAALR